MAAEWHILKATSQEKKATLFQLPWLNQAQPKANCLHQCMCMPSHNPLHRLMCLRLIWGTVMQSRTHFACQKDQMRLIATSSATNICRLMFAHATLAVNSLSCHPVQHICQ